jgi:hypothetical protein
MSEGIQEGAQVCQKFSGYRLARLAMCDRLSQWERNFVHDVSRRRKLTHRQQAIVDRLVATHLEVCN